MLASVATIATLGAQAAPSDPRLMRFPSIHGDTVVFTYAGDLWSSSLKGGLARRLTSSAGSELRAKISPDGKWIAFTGQYEGNSDVYVMPIEGGEPKRLTFDPEADIVANWTPDGKIAYVSSAGSFTNRQQCLWLVKPTGGLPIKTAITEAAEVSYFPDGKTIAYNRMNSYAFNWRRYRGGSQGRISIYNFPENKYSELPAVRDQNYFPMVAKNAIYYISDKKLGTLNLYKYDLGSKKETQLTKFSDEDIKFPSTDGEKIVYERDGFLYTYDLADGAITRLAPKIVAENLFARPYLRSLGDAISSVSISPSGTRVAVEARGELFSVPVKNGDTKNLTETSGARERFPDWSPDGKQVAFVSDKTGNFEVYMKPATGGDAVQLTSQGNLSPDAIEWSPDGKSIMVTDSKSELWVVDVAAKTQKLLLKAKYGFVSPSWSPDSKWIAVSNAGSNQFGAVSVIEVATGKLTPVQDGRYSDGAVGWDQNGKYLYFASTRSFNPSFGAYEFSLKVEDADRIYVLPLQATTPNPLVEPNDQEPVEGAKPEAPKSGGPVEVKIDFEGIGNRAIVLPMPPASYPFVVGANNGVFFMGQGNLVKFDLGSRESSTVFAGLRGSLSINAARTKAAYYGGGMLGVVDLRPGSQWGQGRVDVGQVEAIIDPRAEWNQIFWEAWRYTRDRFYDPGFRGHDWKAIGDHYAAFLPNVNHRSDLNYVLGLMIGELGTGHSYVQGGDFGPGVRAIPVGNLGADYEVASGKIRFKRIYRGENFEEDRRGPLGAPGVDVKEGEYLLEIDGHPVTGNTHPDSLLQNKVNRYVTIKVNAVPSLTGARELRVRPIASESNLRYISWVEDNRKLVEKLSGGRIGYMHVPNTQLQGAIEIIRGFYSQTDKDAMIVDERWNGGGYIQPWFVDTLARKSRAAIQARNAGADGFDAVAIEGPKVMLINGYAGSGGDFFPWMFRQSKLGPLIGNRTWGGLVGITGYAPLVDGGGITAPEFAIYDRETGDIIAENTGVDPDIEVDLRPDLVAKGEDPQLQKAIDVLLEKLKNMPAKKERKAIPTVGKKGQVGDK